MAEKLRATSEPVLIWFGQQDEKSGAADDIPVALGFTRDRTHLPVFLAGSLALHLCVLTAFVLTERAPQLKPDTQQEIPVELVADPAKGGPSAGKDKGKPSGGPAEVKAGAAGKPATSKSADTPKPPAPKPETVKPAVPKPAVPTVKPLEPAAPKPAAEKPPAVKPPEPKPPEPKSLEPKAAPVSQVQKPPPPPAPKPVVPPPVVPKPPPPPPEAVKPLPESPPPQSVPPPAPAPAAAPAAAASTVTPPPAPTGPAGAPEGQPQGVMQDNSPAVAVPQPSDDGDEIVSYQTLVFGMLELKKEFPEDAKRRGVYGTAMIGFELNDDGTVKSEKLLKSSGDAALDIESLALVQRAAPFPKPPDGAQKVFAADITFPPPK